MHAVGFFEGGGVSVKGMEGRWIPAMPPPQYLFFGCIWNFIAKVVIAFNMALKFWSK